MAKSRTTKIDTVDSKETKAIAKKPSEDKAEIAKKKRLVATEQILELISQGLSQTDAISVVGISYSTFHSWMKADAELVADVKRAEISLKLKHLQNIQRHSENDVYHQCDSASAKRETWASCTNQA